MSKLCNSFTNNFTDDLEAWVDATILSLSDGTKCRDGKGDRIEVKIAQSCPTLWPHGLYSPWNSPGQNLELVAIPFSRGSSQPRGWPQVSLTAGGFFTSWATRKESVHVCISVWNNTGQVSYRRRAVFISWIHNQGGIYRHHCKTVWLKWISSQVTIIVVRDEETA